MTLDDCHVHYEHHVSQIRGILDYESELHLHHGYLLDNRDLVLQDDREERPEGDEKLQRDHNLELAPCWDGGYKVFLLVCNGPFGSDIELHQRN